MSEFSEQHDELAPKSEVESAKELAPQPEEGGIAESGVMPGGSAEAEKVVRLSAPSIELATKLLTEVGFNERLVGVSMHPMAGNIEASIYSFEEATNFLHCDEGDLRIRNTGSIGYINLDELKKWVGEVFGDKELAETIGEKIEKGSNYKEQVEVIQTLMEQRLRQCEKIVGVDTET